jgi:hypothetical protein
MFPIHWVSLANVLQLSLSSSLKGAIMRSELVFGATRFVPNRYLLTKLAAKALRALHRPKDRIEETANEVFHRFALTNPVSNKQSKPRSDVSYAYEL